MAEAGPPRSSVALAALLAAAGASVFAWTPLFDTDWPWHLATFDLAWREKRLVWDAPFSYASEGTLPPVHWLFEVALGLSYRALGLEGIVLLRAGLVALAAALLARALVRRGLGALPSAAAALTVAAASRVRFLERPHLVTAIGLVVLWDLLLDFRDRGRKRLFLLVPLFLVWANAHPGVVHGAILATGFLAAEAARVWLQPRFPGLRAMPRERVRALAFWVGLGLLATFVNPAGPGLYPYLIGQRALQNNLQVLELRPIDFSQSSHWVFAGLLALSAAIGIRQRRDLDLTDVGGALGFVVLAFVLAREAGLALASVAIALAPALREIVGEAKDELRDLRDRRLAAFAWAFGLVVGFGYPCFALAQEVASGDLGTGLKAGFYPEREADWVLREQPRGPLYNFNGCGGYLIWRLDPLAHKEWRVFTDGRTPLFAHALGVKGGFGEVEKIWGEPNLVVLDYRHVPWEGEVYLEVAARFALVHFSDGGRTYVRRAGPNAALAARGYGHVRFAGVKDPEARGDWRLSIVVDPRDPASALRELEVGALAEEPSGAWANAAAAEAFLLLGRKADAEAAARRALAARPSLVDARTVLEILDAH